MHFVGCRVWYRAAERCSLRNRLTPTACDNGGRSNTKMWLMRALVRRPPLRATTADISSSVGSEPFISAATTLSRASATAVSAAARGSRGASMHSKSRKLTCAVSAARAILSRGPTNTGRATPCAAMLQAACKAGALQGYTSATPVLLRALSISVCRRGNAAAALMRRSRRSRQQRCLALAGTPTHATTVDGQ